MVRHNHWMKHRCHLRLHHLNPNLICRYWLHPLEKGLLRLLLVEVPGLVFVLVQARVKVTAVPPHRHLQNLT
jgi:hypothetical protein